MEEMIAAIVVMVIYLIGCILLLYWPSPSPRKWNVTAVIHRKTINYYAELVDLIVFNKTRSGARKEAEHLIRNSYSDRNLSFEILAVRNLP